MVTAGEILKNKRESLGKSLTVVSADTKIQRRFLEYIENNEYNKFDSEVFASGFIKIYSKYLGLDVEKLLALYRRSNPKNDKKNNNSSKETKKKRAIKLNISPQLLAVVILSLFFISVIGYIGYQIYQFQKPPQLTILQPEDEYKTEEDTVLVKGNTESSSTVVINGDQVEIDSLGYFEKEVQLNTGVNTITVTSRKNSNNQLETTKTIKVIYNEKEIPSDNQQQDLKEYKLTLKILQSASWIKLDIDGENRISQILQPNTQENFVFKENFVLVTGKVNSTSINVNGEEIEIPSKQNTGVGQITCTVLPTGLECV